MTVVMAMQIVFLLIGQYTVLNHIQPGIGNWVEITGKQSSSQIRQGIQNGVAEQVYLQRHSRSAITSTERWSNDVSGQCKLYSQTPQQNDEQQAQSSFSDKLNSFFQCRTSGREISMYTRNFSNHKA